MNIIVQKFGGTSVNTLTRRLLAAQHIIRAKKEGYYPVVVVSAMGRRGEPYATDTLLNLVKSIPEELEQIIRLVDQTREFQRRGKSPSARRTGTASGQETMLRLLTPGGEMVLNAIVHHTLSGIIAESVRRDLGETVKQTVEEVLKLTHQDGEFDLERFRHRDKSVEPMVADLLLSCGEIVSTAIMAHTLKCLGYPAIALTGGQAGIYTDEVFGDAQIISIDPRGIRHHLEKGLLVVVAGFQGITRPSREGIHGLITTLGRGGSDTTAVALGVALGAERVEIYTDVEGIMTADPRIVKGAKILKNITYEEVCEMGHLGAKVLHPRAAEIAMENKIPLRVKGVGSESPGTEIVPKKKAEKKKQPAVAVTHSPPVSYIQVTLPTEKKGSETEIKIYQTLGEEKVSIYLPTISQEGISFVVDKDLSGKVERILTQLKVKFTVLDKCMIVSLIGSDMRGKSGIMSRIAEALFEAEVPILQLADSENSVSCLIAEADSIKAVRALHRKFELGESRAS